MIARRPIQAVLAALVLSPFAAAAEPAPAPRPLCKRFDLTYLPFVGDRGLLGLRPAEIVRDMPELGLQTGTFLDLMANRLSSSKVNPDDFPALTEIDECVGGFRVEFTSPTGGRRGSTALGWKTPFVVRTIHPFAWETMIKKWFPKAVSTRYGGRTYLNIQLDDLPIYAGFSAGFSAFCPDGRTLVVTGEISMRGLIDRLAAGGPPPTPPAGWDEVDRNPVAFTLDNRTHKFLTGEVVKDNPGYDVMRSLSDSIEFISLGVSAGSGTTFKWVISCANDRRAKQATEIIRDLFELAAAKLEKGTTGAEIASDLLKNLELGRDGRRVSGSTRVGRNLFKMFAMLIHGPA